MPVYLHFWFEFASTYSYLSVMRAREMSAKYGIELVYRPFLLGPVFAKQGLQTSPFVRQNDKNRYMRADIDRISRQRNLMFQLPESFPANSLLAARVSLIALREAWGIDYVESVFVRHFAQGEDISKPECIRAILQQFVAQPQVILDQAVSPENKATLKAATQEAMELGIFGAPSFTTQKGTLFWGDDRFEAAAIHALEEKVAVSP